MSTLSLSAKTSTTEYKSTDSGQELIDSLTFFNITTKEIMMKNQETLMITETMTQLSRTISVIVKKW